MMALTLHARLIRGTTLIALVFASLFGAQAAGQKLAAPPPGAAPQADLSSGGQVDPGILAEYERRLHPTPVCRAEGACAQLQKATLSVSGPKISLRLEIHAMSRTSALLPSLGGAQWEAVSSLGPRFARVDGGVGLLLEPGVNVVELQIAAQGQEVVMSFANAPKIFESSVAGWKLEAPAQGSVSTVKLSKPNGTEKALRTKDRSEEASSVEPQFDAPLFVEATRQLRFDAAGAEIATTFRRLSPSTKPASTTQDLLPGERLVTEGASDASGKKIQVDFPAGVEQVVASTRWDYKGALSLVADPSGQRRETWIVEPWANAPLKFEGVSPINQGGAGLARLMFFPKPGEKLTLTPQFVVPAAGVTVAIDRSSFAQATGEDRLEHAWNFAARSTIAAPLAFSVPDSWKVMGATNNNQPVALSRKGAKYVVDLLPGRNEVVVNFKEDRGSSWWAGAPKVSVDAPTANQSWTLSVPPNQWVLLTEGPLMGPAVLIWGVLVAMGALSWAMAKWIRGLFAPSFAGWLAVLVPISTLSPWSALILVGFVGALAAKRQLIDSIEPHRWNGWQLGIMILGGASALVLLAGIYQGLLGTPDMMVVGNGSSSARLIWYQDKAAMEGGSSAGLSAGALLAPMWLWRSLMLGWALWVASAVFKRVPAMWSVLVAGGLWRKKPVQAAKPKAQSPSSGPPSTAPADGTKLDPNLAAGAPPPSLE